MLVVRHFLKWVNSAPVSQRAAAAGALARAYIGADLPFEERCAMEAALTLLLEDPSDKVRMSIAEALSMSRRAPMQILAALASDQPDIASLVLARSPLFTDDDLIDRVASSAEAVQRIIAGRPCVSMAVSAAIAELGEVEACIALLANAGAEIASLSFRRIAERFGGVAAMREALMADARLPSDCRYTLLVKVGEALRHSPLVAASIGSARAERITRDACVKASLTLIDGIGFDEYAALVEHLRLRGDLTSAFIVRIIAHGKIDFFGSVLVALTRQSPQRVTALLAGGRDVALIAMFREASLSSSVDGIMLRALKLWREVAGGKRIAGTQEISWLMVNAPPPKGGGFRLRLKAGSVRPPADRRELTSR